MENLLQLENCLLSGETVDAIIVVNDQA